MKSKIVTVSTPARLDRQEEVDLVGFGRASGAREAWNNPELLLNTSCDDSCSWKVVQVGGE